MRASIANATPPEDQSKIYNPQKYIQAEAVAEEIHRIISYKGNTSVHEITMQKIKKRIQ